MLRRKALLMILAVFLMLPAIPKSGWTSNLEVSPSANVSYGTGVGKKLGRGLSNIAFGWMELPKGIEDVGEQNNFIAATTWGPIYGLGRTVNRTLAGVYEVVTFPVPLPKDFEPLVQPEFMLGDQW